MQFEQSQSIECDVCNPVLPLKLTDSNKTQFTVHTFGSYVSEQLEHTKCNIDGEMIYPIEYCSTRQVRSYIGDYSTTATCEILIVDENYLTPTDGPGTKDVFLFKVTYKDDEDNPLYVLNSPRFIGSALRERYTNSDNDECAKFGKNHAYVGKTLFGLDHLYVQYLIHIHVQGALDVSSACMDNMVSKLYEMNIIGVADTKQSTTTPATTTKYLYAVNNTMHDTVQHAAFDPQRHLFNF